MSKKMEKEFEKLSNKISEEINIKLNEAAIKLNEAIEIAEKHGVPFSSGISFLPNSYVPTTMRTMHPNLSDEFMSETTGIYDDDCFDGHGWYHSDVC